MTKYIPLWIGENNTKPLLERLITTELGETYIRLILNSHPIKQDMLHRTVTHSWEDFLVHPAGFDIFCDTLMYYWENPEWSKFFVYDEQKILLMIKRAELVLTKLHEQALQSDEQTYNTTFKPLINGSFEYIFYLKKLLPSTDKVNPD